MSSQAWAHQTARVKAELRIYPGTLPQQRTLLHGMHFPKVALLETLTNSVLTSLSGLQPTGCNATKNELINRFLKDVYDNKVKILEIVMQLFSSSTVNYSLLPRLILEIWKIPEILENSKQLSGEVPQKPVSVLKKDSTMDVLPANFQKRPEQLFFQNRSRWMHPEIQTGFILEYQWKTLDG